MNREGFTLIEIIAIVFILGIIFFVGFPTLSNLLTQEDKNKYENMVNDLCSAGKSYMYSNEDKFPTLSEKNATI